jgi:DNA polymerase-3 subunit delta'
MKPKIFNEIRGQDRAIAFLKRIIANHRIASAYLFTGVQGIGKTTAAKAFALSLNCIDPIEGDACTLCESCKRIIDGNHPDLLVLEPDKEGKVIGIDKIREIERGVAFSPMLGGYRVIIVDPAEKMTNEAANAFLKTLEEPPARNVFILNVRDPGELFPTIVSRCQRVPFKPIPADVIGDWLIGEGYVDPERARIVARLSEGSFGRATRLATDELFTQRVQWLTTLHRIVDGSLDALLDLAQEYSGLEKKTESDKEQKDKRVALMLGIWKSWFRDLLLIKSGGTQDLIFNSDLDNHLQRASRRYSSDALVRSLSVISRAERDFMSNKNLHFLIERSMIGLRAAAG